ncbi:MAG: phosphomannomutase/phosphoglucomutase [Sporichthyaceae bacterium]
MTASAGRDLSTIVKAYDIRGIVGSQWDADVAFALGVAFAEVTAPDGRSAPVVVGRDMRPSSPELSAAFAAGANSRGRDVIDVGLVCTDAVYYASGAWSCPGAMFTASHNPAQYNGIKFCRAGAVPVGADTGLAQMRALAEDYLADPSTVAPVVGTTTTREVLEDFAAFLHSLVTVPATRRLRVAVDAGNGMAGRVVPVVFADLPVEVIPLYFELDGSFPHHEPNPIDPANLRDLCAAVLAHGADLGLAFDGDADRCFVVDERGEPITPSAVCGLIAERELARAPGSAIVHNLITSRALPELVLARGGRPVRTRVGHSFIKAVMADTGAVFGGEHSGHYYFRDFWRADSGMLAALHVLAALAEVPGTASQLLGGYTRYVASGELNSTVADPVASLTALREHWSARGAELDELDGLTVSLGADWFNVRPSNTEPLLRLNVEAADVARMLQLRDEVLDFIRSTAGKD